MEAFSMLLALCAGNSPVTGEFPSQKDSNADFDTNNQVILDYMTFIMFMHRHHNEIS